MSRTVISEVYPGKVMPVGARYQHNQGASLKTAFKAMGASPDGLGQSDLGPGFRGFVFAIQAGFGWYIGGKLGRGEAKKNAKIVGALATGVGGVPGAALTAFLYGKGGKS